MFGLHLMFEVGDKRGQKWGFVWGAVQVVGGRSNIMANR